LGERLKNWGPWAALVVVASFVSVGDFDVRLSDAQFDDHFAVFAQWLSRPELYLKDTIRYYGPSYLSTSILNWGPSVLLGILPIGWKAMAILLVLAQNLLLFFALRAYTSIFTPAPWKANFVAFAIFAGGLWRINLAMFPGVSHTPYPGTFVLPCLLFTTVFLFKKKWRRSAGLLGVCFLIHPAMALLYLPFWIAGVLTFGGKFHRLVFGLVAAGVGMLPTLVAQWWRGPGISSDGQLSTMLANWHMVPWKHASFWSWDLPSYLGWIALFILAVSQTRLLRRRQFYFLGMAFAALAIFALVNVTGVYFGIPAFLQLVPLRVSQITLLLIQPIAILYLAEILEAGERGSQEQVVFFLGLQAYSGVGFLWPFLILLRWSRGVVVGRGLLFLVVGLLVLPRPLGALGWESASALLRALVWPGGGYSLSALAILVVASITVLVLARRVRAISLPQATIAGLTILLFWNAWQTSARVRNPRVRDYYEAQRWARRATRPGTVFVTSEESWRGVSHRPAVYLHPPPFEVYVKSRGYRQVAGAIRALASAESDREKWDRETVARFAREFGGEYWVRDARYPLDLREAYRNDSYIIYSLHNL